MCCVHLMQMNHTKVHNIISVLVELPTSIEQKVKFLQQLKKNIEKALELMPASEELAKAINEKCDATTTKFVLISLYILKILSKFPNDDSPSNLMSVQQQKKIKVLLQMIISLGLTPWLDDGVNTTLKNKTSQLYLLNLEKLTLTESYILMCNVIRSLLEILTTPNLRYLILTHLGDLLSVLLQVTYKGKIKKPVKNNSKDDVNKLEAASEFIMTEECYQQLIKDRNEFKNIYKDLVDNIYKPLVIKELLILLAPIKSIENNKIITPPVWLKKAISYQLTEYLTSPNGVSFIMKAICDSGSDAVDWKKTEVIARIISTTHRNFTDDTFYAIISPQIISLLNSTGPYCIPVAKNCIKNIYYYNVDICKKYIFENLFEPLRLCARPVSENFSGILVSEDTLSQCIKNLFTCFVSGSKNFSIPLTVLTEIIKILYVLYMKISKSPYQHKTAIEDLLIQFLYSVNNTKKLTAIYNALIFNEPHEDMLEINKNLEFQFGPSAEVQVGKCGKNACSKFPLSELQLEFETTGDHMLDLLSQRQEYSKKLFSDLFVSLLSVLADSNGNKFEPPNSNPNLLEVEELIVLLVKTSQKRIITIKLLAVLAENVHVMETIQENPDIVFKFVHNLLNVKANEMVCEKMKFKKEHLVNDKENFNEESNIDNAEDLFVLLSVIDLITVNVKSDSNRWQMCKSLIDTLEIIKDYSQDSNVKDYSDHLLKRIITHGAVRAVSGIEKAMNKSENEKKLKISHFPSLLTKEKREKEKKLNTFFLNEITKKDKQKGEIDILFEEICSDDVPTRGHAIIQLSKLIKLNDSRLFSKKDYIFSVLKCNLRHQDTYIYLSAINALETLASVQAADKILEVLCEEYTEHKKEFSEIQMKIGEVLMRIIRNLGEMAPKYKSLLVNTFLWGTKSFDQFLRASSLSNLGELLKILGFSVGNILQEVFVCVKAIAMTDKSEIVRRAAVMVALFLLKGVKENSFIILQPIIRDLYKTLLEIYKREYDEVTKLHAELALAEIDRLVKSSINRNLKLEKHIGILYLNKQ